MFIFIHFDMLARIRNANLVKSRSVVILRTKLTLNICQILKQEGFIDSFEEFGDIVFTETGFFHKFISLNLKYKGIKQKPYITCLKRISKPGFRVYVNQNNVPKVLGGIGVAVRLLCLFLSGIDFLNGLLIFLRCLRLSFIVFLT